MITIDGGLDNRSGRRLHGSGGRHPYRRRVKGQQLVSTTTKEMAPTHREQLAHVHCR